MANPKFGIWFIGAWGGVATTSAVGLAALQKGVTTNTGLVTAHPMFADIDLADWDSFVIGGHEIRETTFLQEAQILREKSQVFSQSLLDDVAPILEELDSNIRPGTLINVGETIHSLAGSKAKKNVGESPRTAIERISADLNCFRDARRLDHVIVMNLASTEPPLSTDSMQFSWDELNEILHTADESPIPASSIYAVAAMQSGCSFVNFTPSVGSNIPALYELAEQQNVLHVGRDGKTGETLLKSVLAPMFAARNLNVMSWVGHNIFGNMDGVVLNDPANKATKVHSKDHLLSEIFGYSPQTLVSIEYIESLGDWKTAWDHIHFEGFLGTKMMMQFTWQGCDSLLAAPLVLDLVRLTERERRRGTSGAMEFLASFFKSPMGDAPPEFAKQYILLEEWARQVSEE